MKIKSLVLYLVILAMVSETFVVDAKDKKKKKKDKKSKIKVKFKGGGSDRVGCEPDRFTFYTFEDPYCNIKTGVKYLDSF